MPGIVNCYRIVTTFFVFVTTSFFPFVILKAEKEVLDIIYIAFCRGIGPFFALFLILPAALIFLAYLLYIIVMTLKELLK